LEVGRWKLEIRIEISKKKFLLDAGDWKLDVGS
jgi:hypothetical protein